MPCVIKTRRDYDGLFLASVLTAATCAASRSPQVVRSCRRAGVRMGVRRTLTQTVVACLYSTVSVQYVPMPMRHGHAWADRARWRTNARGGPSRVAELARALSIQIVPVWLS